MKRELISKAINQVDADIICEALTYRKSAPERNNEMTEKAGFKLRRAVIAALAACAAIALAVTAYAANLWGIRELWRTDNRELPQEAEELIRDESEKAETDNWSAEITQSLYDGRTVMVAVNVSGGDGYIVAPTDASPEDSIGEIGIDGDETLREYAENHAKKLLLVGARLDADELGATESMTFRSISESEMAILIESDLTVSEPSIDITCTVYVEEDGEVQRIEMPLTLSAEKVKEVTLIPADPDIIPGMSIGNATVTDTALGISVSIPITVESDEDIYVISRLECDEMPGYGGGFIKEAENLWVIRWTKGQGSVTDTLSVRFFGAGGEELGTAVFSGR